MRRLALLLASLASCSSLEPEADLTAVRDSVLARTGLDVAIPAADHSATLDAEAAALLQQPLHDDDGVRIALLNNRDVRAALARLGITRAELVQAGLLRNPVFDAMAKFYGDGGTELELDLAAPFVDLFWRPLRVRLAEHEFAAMQTMVTRELVHLAARVRGAFVHVRTAQQLVALQTAALATAQAAHELARTLHAAGNTTDQTLAAWRVAESRARLDLAAAEQSVSEAHEPVHRLLGLHGAAAQCTIAGELAPEPLAGLDLEHIESRAIAASLDLQEQRARLEALAQEQGLTSWQAWFPDASAGVGATREVTGDWGVGPEVMLELPLFDGGKARTHRAEQAVAEGLHRHTQLAIEVRSVARQLRDRAQSLAARLQFLRTVHLPLREDYVQRVVQNYNAMQIGAFDVLQARQQQLVDEREALALLRDAHLARIDLLELLGGSLPQPTKDATWPATGPGNGSHTKAH